MYESSSEEEAPDDFEDGYAVAHGFDDEFQPIILPAPSIADILKETAVVEDKPVQVPNIMQA